MPDGEGLRPAELARIVHAVRVAEQLSGLRFSVFVGVSEQDARGQAERLHATLASPEAAVLLLCDPVSRVLEIVTGSRARRRLDDVDCRLAAASMEISFQAGDLVNGLVTGIQQLGSAARQPRALHTARQG